MFFLPSKPAPWIVLISTVVLLVGCATPPPPTPPVKPVRIEPTPVKTTPEVGAVGSPALQARFAAPSVNFASPGFENGQAQASTQAQLQAFMKKLAQDEAPSQAGGPLTVRLIELGRSELGTALQALVLTRQTSAEPAELARGNRPTVLLMGQQHGDEPASSEALLLLAQQLAQGEGLQMVLDRVNVVILPRVNPDGAARRQAMNAKGLDINRDHLALRSPEARAVAKIMQDFAPLVVVDSHEYPVRKIFVDKFGLDQGVDAMVQYATNLNAHEFITRSAREWFYPAMVESLKPINQRIEWHYDTSEVLSDKKVSTGGVHPNTARNVTGLRNVVSLMVETRGAGLGPLNFKRRVQAQLALMGAVLRTAAVHAQDLVKIKKYVDSEVRAQACQGSLALDAQPIVAPRTLQMIHPTTGADQAINVDWVSSVASTEFKNIGRPCGYWLASDQAPVATRLRNLGIKVDQLGSAMSLQVQGGAERLEAPKGSYYVSLAQPLANLAAATLEPESQQGASTPIAAPSWARVTTRPVGLNSVRTLPAPPVRSKIIVEKDDTQ